MWPEQKRGIHQPRLPALRIGENQFSVIISMSISMTSLKSLMLGRSSPRPGKSLRQSPRMAHFYIQVAVPRLLDRAAVVYRFRNRFENCPPFGDRAIRDVRFRKHVAPFDFQDNPRPPSAFPAHRGEVLPISPQTSVALLGQPLTVRLRRDRHASQELAQDHPVIKPPLSRLAMPKVATHEPQSLSPGGTPMKILIQLS